MEINKSILFKAKNINALKNKEKKERKKKSKKEKKYIKECIKANICPICGEPLLKRAATKLEERESLFDFIEYILYCEKSNYTYIKGRMIDDEA